MDFISVHFNVFKMVKSEIIDNIQTLKKTSGQNEAINYDFT